LNAGLDDVLAVATEFVDGGGLIEEGGVDVWGAFGR
jgi:hypothetical protein